MKKIVLISVGQPSSNPRLVKEANSLEKAGFDVYVVYSFWNQWATEADKYLFSKVGWTPILAGGSPFENRPKYFFTRLRAKLLTTIAKKVTFKLGIAEVAKGRAYPELLKKAKSIKADLYIAHILAALPVAVKAAKKNSARCGFDVEDFHRQEVSDDYNSFQFKISNYLEDKYVPQLDYLTASSPLIADQYASQYKRKITVLLNVFPKVSHASVGASTNDNGPLKLFWFSQTIGPGRGIESIIEAMALTGVEMELHLLGQIVDGYKLQLLQQTQTSGITDSVLHFYTPVRPDEIFHVAAKFDIGIASEPGFCLNNNLALSNKLFTYIQCGLAIAVSNTPAQHAFINQYPNAGKMYDHPKALSIILKEYDQNRDMLSQTKKAAFKFGQADLNWEKESEKFLQVISDTLPV